MNVLVTGHAGFVGRYLTYRLLQKGYYVFGFDKQKSKDSRIKRHKNFKQRQVDLCSYSSVLKACQSIQDIKYIFHTVAIQPYNKEMDIKEYMEINVGGAVNLLRACNACNLKHIIVSSSFSVYGQPEYLPMDENHPTRPINIYGLSKLQAESLFEFYARKMGFHIVILRYDGIYGHGQTIPGFIQYLIISGLREEDIELFNEGKQVRDNVYVDDVVDANIKAMKIVKGKNFNVFNIGGDDPKTSFETTDTVRKIIRRDFNIVLSSRESPLGFDIYMDNQKAKDVLGYHPKKLAYNINKMIKLRNGK